MNKGRDKGELQVKREMKKYLFLLPNVIGMLLFYLLSMGYCFLYAFSSKAGRFSFGGLKNYISLFQSATFFMAFTNTYILMGICIVSLFLLTIVLEYVLDSSALHLMLLMLLSVPMLLPPNLITSYAVDLQLSPRIVLVFIFIWKYLGFHVFLLKMAEMGMHTEWMDAALLDHASKWQMFLYIRLPYLFPYIRFLLIFDGVCFFRLFRESYLLYGQYPSDEVYTMIHFFFNNFQNMNYQRLAAAAVVTLVPFMVWNIFLWKAGDQYEMV